MCKNDERIISNTICDRLPAYIHTTFLTRSRSPTKIVRNAIWEADKGTPFKFRLSEAIFSAAPRFRQVLKRGGAVMGDAGVRIRSDICVLE